jgi:hypothetical protein
MQHRLEGKAKFDGAVRARKMSWDLQELDWLCG